VDSINQIIPEALAVISAILGFVAQLTGKTIDPAVVAEIQAIANQATKDLQDIETLAKQYNAEPGANQGLLQSIAAAGQAIVANMQPLINDAHVKDAATQKKLTAFATLVVAEVEAVISTLGLLNAPQGSTVTIKIPMSKDEFKVAFDAILSSPTGQPDVDVALSHIHKM
jgi:hypothetical protein